MELSSLAQDAARRLAGGLRSLVDPLRSLADRYRFRRHYVAPAFVDLAKLREYRGEVFPRGEPDCWLDRPDALQEIDRRLADGVIDAAQAEACRFWVENGYFIAPKLIDDALLDEVWAAYEKALAAGVFGERRFVDAAQTLDDRQLDPHLQLPVVRSLQCHPAVLRWTDLFFGRKTVPFQTILGHAGSQQRAHSDSIHMTTYPLGYLAANWVAFENIVPDSGPLDYYPGSHKLPYLLSADVGIDEYEFKQKGYSIYNERYEPMIEGLCVKAGLERKVFLANKGDVLFWHANLVHGGSPRLDESLSRKALVCHYFAEGVVTYHDLSGNPSRLHKDGIYEPLAH